MGASRQEKHSLRSLTSDPDGDAKKWINQHREAIAAVRDALENPDADASLTAALAEREVCVKELEDEMRRWQIAHLKARAKHERH